MGFVLIIAEIAYSKISAYFVVLLLPLGYAALEIIAHYHNKDHSI
jgi:hypothetical protein